MTGPAVPSTIVWPRLGGSSGGYEVLTHLCGCVARPRLLNATPASAVPGTFMSERDSGYAGRESRWPSSARTLPYNSLPFPQGKIAASARCRVCIRGTYGGQGEAAGCSLMAGGFAVLEVVNATSATTPAASFGGQGKAVGRVPPTALLFRGTPVKATALRGHNGSFRRPQMRAAR